MPRPPEILTSLQNPRVKAVVRLRDRRHRNRERRFLAEGVREVTRALDAGMTLLELYVAPELLADPPGDWINLPEVMYVSPPVLTKMAYRDPPEGALGVFELPERDLSTLPPPEPGSLLLVTVGTEKPGNLGAMARTAAAAGCHALLAADGDVDLFNPNAIRNSTGAVFSLPCVTCDGENARQWLRTHDVVTAAAVVEHGQSLWTADLPSDRPTALIIGPEHAGLDETWTHAADVRLTIPTAAAGVDSLNASTAAAVLLFELVRRRQSS